MTFLPRDAEADHYLKNRTATEVPGTWKEFKDAESTFRVYVPADLQATKSRKGVTQFECKSADGTHVFRVVVRNLQGSSRISSPKGAAESLAFSKGVGPGFSGKCNFAGVIGHEVEFTFMSPSPRRVSVRSIRSNESILVFSCERDLRDISTRIPNAFFDSVSLLRKLN